MSAQVHRVQSTNLDERGEKSQYAEVCVVCGPLGVTHSTRHSVQFSIDHIAANRKEATR